MTTRYYIVQRGVGNVLTGHDRKPLVYRNRDVAEKAMLESHIESLPFDVEVMSIEKFRKTYRDPEREALQVVRPKAVVNEYEFKGWFDEQLTKPSTDEVGQWWIDRLGLAEVAPEVEEE